MADLIMRKDTELSVLVPQIWSQNFYDVLLASLPFNSIISKDYEGEIQALGDRVKISSIPEFADAILMDESAKVDADAVTVTQQDLLINKRVVKDFIVTDLAQLQSIPFVEKMKELAQFAIMKKMQAEIIAATVPSASSPDHTIAYASGTTLALVDILTAKELLDAQNVPMGDRQFVVGAAQLNDIFNITGFTSSDFLASGAPLASGQLPAQLVGMKPNFTTVVGNTSYWFHPSYMTVAVQKGMSVSESSLLPLGIRGTRVSCDVLFGLKQLDNKRVVTIS